MKRFLILVLLLWALPAKAGFFFIRHTSSFTTNAEAGTASGAINGPISNNVLGAGVVGGSNLQTSVTMVGPTVTNDISAAVYTNDFSATPLSTWLAYTTTAGNGCNISYDGGSAVKIATAGGAGGSVLGLWYSNSVAYSGTWTLNVRVTNLIAGAGAYSYSAIWVLSGVTQYIGSLSKFSPPATENNTNLFCSYTGFFNTVRIQLTDGTSSHTSYLAHVAINGPAIATTGSFFYATVVSASVVNAGTINVNTNTLNIGDPSNGGVSLSVSQSGRLSIAGAVAISSTDTNGGTVVNNGSMIVSNGGVNARDGFRTGTGDTINVVGSALQVNGGTIGSSGGPYVGGVNNAIQPTGAVTAANGITAGQDDAIVSGSGNLMSYHPYSVIGGGLYNSILNPDGGGNGLAGFIGGGAKNTCRWDKAYMVIGGGLWNLASNHYATVPGGRANIAGGISSLAAGLEAEAVFNGDFVWADYDGDTNGSFTATGPDQFLIRAHGGVCINTNGPASTGGTNAMLTVNGSISVTGSGHFGSNSVYIADTALSVGQFGLMVKFPHMPFRISIPLAMLACVVFGFALAGHSAHVHMKHRDHCAEVEALEAKLRKKGIL